MVKNLFLVLFLFFISQAAWSQVVEAEEPEVCQNAITTAQMKECAGAYFEMSDAVLNQTWYGIAACFSLAQGDEAWKLIVKEQRSWIKFRDNFCESVANQVWSNGTGWSLGYLDCKTKETYSRAEYLNNFYGHLNCEESEPGEL